MCEEKTEKETGSGDLAEGQDAVEEAEAKGQEGVDGLKSTVQSFGLVMLQFHRTGKVWTKPAILIIDKTRDFELERWLEQTRQDSKLNELYVKRIRSNLLDLRESGGP